MTFKQKYTENKKMIRLYADFMPLANKETDILKLSREITRLSVQNELIMAMPVANYTKDALIRKETVPQL